MVEFSSTEKILIYIEEMERWFDCSTSDLRMEKCLIKMTWVCYTTHCLAKYAFVKACC